MMMQSYECPKCHYGQKELIRAKFAGDCPKCNDGTAMVARADSRVDILADTKPPSEPLTIGMVARGETKVEKAKVMTTGDVKADETA